MSLQRIAVWLVCFLVVGCGRKDAQNATASDQLPDILPVLRELTETKRTTYDKYLDGDEHWNFELEGPMSRVVDSIEAQLKSQGYVFEKVYLGGGHKWRKVVGDKNYSSIVVRLFEFTAEHSEGPLKQRLSPESPVTGVLIALKSK